MKKIILFVDSSEERLEKFARIFYYIDQDIKVSKFNFKNKNLEIKDFTKNEWNTMDHEHIKGIGTVLRHSTDEFDYSRLNESRILKICYSGSIYNLKRYKYDEEECIHRPVGYQLTFTEDEIQEILNYVENTLSKPKLFFPDSFEQEWENDLG